MKLEAELRAIREEKKAACERTREHDERLRKIREDEIQKEESLHQMRLERISWRKSSKYSKSLETLKVALQRIANFSRKQLRLRREKEREIEKQARRIRCLEDEISAVKQLAAETQLRQLNELKSLTKETRELKETLTELHCLQQQATAEEHNQGKYYRISSGSYLLFYYNIIDRLID